MPMMPTTPLALGMMPVTLLGPQLGPLYTLHADIAESVRRSAHVTAHNGDFVEHNSSTHAYQNMLFHFSTCACAHHVS